MKKFTTLDSTAIPLPLKDIDTDVIIPAQFLTRINKSGYGECLFRRLRDNDENFPLNLDRYKESQILIAQDNFGCGSSREHAVWALMDYGIKVIIAPSFADIFKSNSNKNGLVLVELDSKIIKNLINKSKCEALKIKVNLENQTITLKNSTSHSFPFDPFRKECILNGLDDMDYILKHQKEIDYFFTNQKNKFYY